MFLGLDLLSPFIWLDLYVQFEYLGMLTNFALFPKTFSTCSIRFPMNITQLTAHGPRSTSIHLLSLFTYVSTSLLLILLSTLISTLLSSFHSYVFSSHVPSSAKTLLTCYILRRDGFHIDWSYIHIVFPRGTTIERKWVGIVGVKCASVIYGQERGKHRCPGG